MRGVFDDPVPPSLLSASLVDLISPDISSAGASIKLPTHCHPLAVTHTHTLLTQWYKPDEPQTYINKHTTARTHTLILIVISTAPEPVLRSGERVADFI